MVRLHVDGLRLGPFRFLRLCRGHHLTLLELTGLWRVHGQAHWTLLPDDPHPLSLPHRLAFDARLWRQGDAIQALLRVGRLGMFGSLWIGPHP